MRSCTFSIIWYGSMSRHVQHVLEKKMLESLLAWRFFFHHNSRSFHLELWKWLWNFEGFGHPSYAHQWWVWSVYIKIIYSWVFVGIICTFQKYIAWECFYISCVLHLGWWINLSNHGTTLDNLWLLFGFSREGLSNDIFFGIAGYQGCHKRKYVYCPIFLLKKIGWNLSKFITLLLMGLPLW